MSRGSATFFFESLGLHAHRYANHIAIMIGEGNHDYHLAPMIAYVPAEYEERVQRAVAAFNEIMAEPGEEIDSAPTQEMEPVL